MTLSEALPEVKIFSLLQLTVVSITGYTCLWIIYCRTWHPLAKVPGPFWASVTRFWYMYRIIAADMDRVQRALHKKYGPLVRIGPDEVSSANPSDIPLIYRTSDPLIKTDFYSIWADPSLSKYPDMFTCRDEKYHAQIRKTVNPVYTLGNILKHEDHIGKCTQLLVQRLGEFADKDEVVDIGRWVQMYAFDVLGDLLFGKMFGFMEKREDHGTLIASIDAVLPVIVTAAVAPSSYRPFIMGSSMISATCRRAMKGLGVLRQAALDAVADRKKQVEDGVADRYDLLQQMMDIAQDENGKKVDYGYSEISCHCWSNMFAGSDTTAAALRAALHCLLKSPRRMERVRAELLKEDIHLSSPIKYAESTTRLPYLCACIKEAMRLYPSPGISLQRTSPRQGIIMSGKLIPEGYRVGVSPVVVTYDEATYGPDAAEFNPERWLVNDEELRVLEKGMALTFGAGTRTCTGKNIALADIYTAIPELLRRFDFELVGDWKLMNRWFFKQEDFFVKLSRREFT